MLDPQENILRFHSGGHRSNYRKGFTQLQHDSGRHRCSSLFRPACHEGARV